MRRTSGGHLAQAPVRFHTVGDAAALQHGASEGTARQPEAAPARPERHGRRVAQDEEEAPRPGLDEDAGRAEEPRVLGTDQVR